MSYGNIQIRHTNNYLRMSFQRLAWLTLRKADFPLAQISKMKSGHVFKGLAVVLYLE